MNVVNPGLEALRAGAPALQARWVDPTSPVSRTALDDVASHGGLQRSLDELIEVAVEVCGARSATVGFVNEGEGLLTIFGPRMPHRLEHTLPLAGRALEFWRQVRDAPGWQWLACIFDALTRHGVLAAMIRACWSPGLSRFVRSV